MSGSIVNNGGASDDDGFGMYWGSDASNAYAIYREAGGWTYPYPDLRIAFHTGIKLGANASYQGIKFYNDYDMATQVMSVNNGSDGLGANNVYVNNSLQAGSSLRAPIFYDSNDNNYYVDPASTSRVNVISFVSGATFGPYFQFNNQSNLRLQAGQQSGGIGISGYDFNGNWLFQLYGDSNGYGFLNGNWAGWDIKKIASGNLYLNNQTSYYISTSEIYYNRVYGLADIRSPIFYDNDNTGYYLDPASTSNLNVAKANYFCGNAGNTYGQYKGYDNNNHFITIRGAVSGTTSSPTITGAHQTTLVEYAEVNDSTGWFFKTAGAGNYDIVSRITRSYSSFEGSARAPLFYDSNVLS